MTLGQDSQIGPYRIQRELGRGGMGVVYLAVDERLGREVAIKALPEHLASDPDRLARFQREARVLASLNHPNIAGIHGLEEAGGQHYLVLEYVEGESLDAVLERGPMPVDDAVETAVAIARALEAAHDKGIVHRDLKPANIIITPEGVPKVLDFGLARQSESSGSTTDVSADSPTLTSPPVHSPTIPGAIMGTAGYMSPEQARGRHVDKRSDVFSFGCVLYEMLTGARPFSGETVPDILGATIHKDLDLTLLPSDTPPNTRRVLDRCLRKDKRQRLHDIADARIELQTPEAAAATAQPDPRRRALIPAAVVLVALCAAAFAWVFRPPPATPGRAELPLLKFVIEEPVDPSHTFITPDASAVVFSQDEGESFRVRRFRETESRTVELPWPASPAGWSPDGRDVIVLRGEIRSAEIWRVNPDNPEPRFLGRLPDRGFFWWGGGGVQPYDDDTILFAMATNGLFTMPAGGGEPRQILASVDEEIIVSPSVIPGTDAVLFANVTEERIEILNNGQRTTLIERPGDRVVSAHFSPPGFVLFQISSGVSRAGVWAVPFSSDTLEVTGPAVRLFDVGGVSIARNGTMAFTVFRRVAPEPRLLVWADRTGAIEPVVSQPILDASTPSLSPDGDRIAVSGKPDQTSDLDRRDIFLVNTRTGSRLQLTDPVGNDFFPLWHPDGDRLYFNAWSAGIRQLRRHDLSGRGSPELVSDRSATTRRSNSGDFVYSWLGEIDRLDLATGDRTTVIDEATFDFDVSPDGRYLAYKSEVDSNILLRLTSGAGGRSIISAQNAAGIRFAADGTELYFWSGETLMATPVDLSGDQPVIGPTTPLFDAAPARLRSGLHYEPVPDGRFLMIQRPEGFEDENPDRIIITQNWAAEFAANAP